MPAIQTTADIVNDWARRRLANGAIARDTEAYNQVWGALPALIAALASDLAPEPTPKPTDVSAPGPDAAPVAAPETKAAKPA